MNKIKIKITDPDSLYFGDIFDIVEARGEIVSIDAGGGALTWFHEAEFEYLDNGN